VVHPERVNARDEICRLHRRAGFGLPIAGVRRAVERGSAAEIDLLLGAVPADDPWDNGRLPLEPMNRDAAVYAIHTWVETMVASETPLAERVAWMWHGHFVSAIDKVRVARLMVDQVRLFRRAGLGPFRDLLRAVTIDPAMLVYLDLRTSTGAEPNENYARELLELFTLGEGNYSEADVKAGAVALTGWTLVRGDGSAVFRPGRHDDARQRYLGRDEVHDLDSVVDAVVAHGSLPVWIASTVAAEFLGSSDPAFAAELAGRFTAAGFDVAELVRATLEAVVTQEGGPIVLAPLPWYVIARRVTGSVPDPRQAVPLLRAAGQLPMLPPNVAGWPGGAAWFSASSLVARANLAALVASAVPEGEVLAAAHGDDPSALADVLGLPSIGFGPESAAALAAAAPGPDRLAVALITPEFVIA
jgi:uncharacterized protein (DUF1800 family)